jgi:hypothetical protein
MRFFLDEDLSDRIAGMAQLRGVDVISVRQARRGGLTDEEQLLFAGQEGRCIVTRNTKHFAPLSKQFEDQGPPHAGVACVPDSLPGQRFDAEHPDGVPPYSVWWLTPERD